MINYKLLITHEKNKEVIIQEQNIKIERSYPEVSNISNNRMRHTV